MHGHPGAFSLDCVRCQDEIDPDRRHRIYRSNLSRPGRVSPLSSRIIGIGEGLHPRGCGCRMCGSQDAHSPSCPCRRCVPADVRAAAWLWCQLWEWTPAGQFAYWTLALVLTHFYS